MRTKIIYQNQHYTACELNGGLIVTSNHGKSGTHLVGEQASLWIDAITSETDPQTANALCRAVYEARSQ